MYDDEHSEGGAKADQDEAFLVRRRVVWIGEDERMLVREGSFSFVKADPMLSEIDARFRRVPLEVQVGHDVMYIQRTYLSTSGVRGLTRFGL